MTSYDDKYEINEFIAINAMLLCDTNNVLIKAAGRRLKQAKKIKSGLFYLIS